VGQEWQGVEQAKLSGNVIVSELIRNMELGRFEMAYSVLLPCVFTIYLNPQDYAALRGVFDLVVEDARRALRARAAELSSSTIAKFGKRKGTAKEHKIACREWSLEFLPEPEVPAGDVEIHSELSEVIQPGFRGTRTTLIGREPALAERTRVRQGAEHSVTNGARPVYAVILYEDEAGKQTYHITQNQVRIGRGGEEEPVDLMLRASDEISRQHLLIQREPATGGFSVLDGSTNGTWINGKRLSKGTAQALPRRAEIRLGEVLTLTFEVRL